MHIINRLMCHHNVRVSETDLLFYVMIYALLHLQHVILGEMSNDHNSETHDLKI